MTNPDPLYVPANEYGRVRIFTTDAQPEGASAITPNNVEKLLGVELNARKVEIVPSGVLKEMGLTNYLIEGYGVAASDIAGRQAALDALSGLVILLPSSAFKGEDVTLTPDASLRLVGMFEEEAHRAHDATVPDAPPAYETKRTTPRPGPQTSRRGSSMIALGALIIAAALLLFFVLN